MNLRDKLRAALKPKRNTSRADDGRYHYSDMDRMCVCGHDLGCHGITETGYGAGCLYGGNQAGVGPDDAPACECRKFKASRRKS
jgi:hypothetical protein